MSTETRYPARLTAEDFEIMLTLSHAGVEACAREGEHGEDFRAMLAREVFAEREWRVRGRAVTPAYCLDMERMDTIWSGDLRTLRERVEACNGEPLA